MRLAERTKEDLKSFDDTIASIANGCYDEDIGVRLLNAKCINISLDAQIA